jgi:hypothetical protein
VVVHREALRLRLRGLGEALRAGQVEVAAAGRADVAGDAVAAPAEVIGRSDVREEVEAFAVAQVLARLDQPGRIDNQGRLAVRLAGLDEAGDAFVGQLATPRIS